MQKDRCEGGYGGLQLQDRGVEVKQPEELLGLRIKHVSHTDFDPLILTDQLLLDHSPDISCRGPELISMRLRVYYSGAVTDLRKPVAATPTGDYVLVCVGAALLVLPGTTLPVRTAKVFTMGEERRRSAFHSASTSGASRGAAPVTGNQPSGPLREEGGGDYSTALCPGPLLGGAAAEGEKKSEAEIGSKYEEADQKPVLAPLRSPAGPQACKPLAGPTLLEVGQTDTRTQYGERLQSVRSAELQDKEASKERSLFCEDARRSWEAELTGDGVRCSQHVRPIVKKLKNHKPCFSVVQERQWLKKELLSQSLEGDNGGA
ncbi:unnamed protein product [Pleuronectes platessa]|uniref:Uncharacterized protein n=1 Tax=Pleuronectes platessa TaxID=8262 RepID=A0A9N7ZA40_PLEPL|nr:unnamed protein product [Pleuronectes platessa]